MKPISLTFQAFGSYPGKVDIDFVRLWQHGVFTITGRNGAGKTTIFDAMVYALYNEMPGYREVADVRSHFADPTTETFVEFVFEVDGVRWRITRKPTQTRPKARGTGDTVETASVLLRRADETSGGTTRMSAAKDEVERLIGLNASQFQQVILIPQGKFEDVLKEETAKRLEVLRQLFPVEIYKCFADEVLKGLRDDAKAAYEDAATRTEGARLAIVTEFGSAGRLLAASDDSADGPETEAATAHEAIAQLSAQTLTLDDVDSVLALVSKARTLLETRRDAAGAAAAELTEQVRVADTAEQELDAFRKAQADAEAFPQQEKVDQTLEADLVRATKAQGALPLVGQLTTAERNLGAAQRALPAHERSAKHALPAGLTWPEQATAAALRALQNQAATLRGSGAASAQDAQRLLAAVAELAEAHEAKVLATDGVQQWQTYLDAIKAEDTELAAELKKLTPARAALATVQEAVARLEEELAELESARDLDAEIKAAVKEAAAAESAEKVAAAAVEKAQKAVAMDAAVQAAALLRDGEACPTCGALEHPKPAKARKGIGEVDLEELLAAREEARAVLLAATTGLATLQGAKSADKRRAATAVEADISKQRAKEEGLAAQVARVEEIEERRQEIAADKDEANANLGEFKTDLASANTTLKGEAALTKQVSAFESKHGPLADFTFDERAWDSFTSALNDLIETVDAQASAATAVENTSAALAPVLADLGLTSAADVAALAMGEAEVAQQRAQIQQRVTHRALVSRQISDYIAAGKPLQLPDTQDLRTRLEAAKALHEHLADRFSRLSQTCDNISRGRAAFADQALALESARAAFQEAETLYKVCAGQGGGIGDKIKLETWVLAYYLRQVVAQANIRMQRLFGGRYQLFVADKAETQQGHFGLDLEVFDAETGKRRSVRGMSNGETFKAALALALGLSDVVAMGANRRIDALFIDEGFGALDGPSREAVVDIFDRLQQTGRMVGLITHVTELQQALPLGISVRQGEADNGGGSSLEVHYPQE